MIEENYFKKLNSIAGEVEKKNNLSYISWATAWEMTKKEFPDATYTIYENQDGNAFWETKFGIDVKVGVTIKGIEHIVRLPVMDGANKAMKSESYTYKGFAWVGGKKTEVEKTCEQATQFDINKAIQRAFTKAMAMHGIGLYVYRGEDLPEEERLSIEEWIALFQDETDINHLATLWSNFNKEKWTEKQIKWATEEKDKAKAKLQ